MCKNRNTLRNTYAAPYIQAPYELQSHNRYAYVMNNPLLYTDPSGYWSWKSIFKFVIVAIAVYVTMGAAAIYLTGASTFSAAFGAIAAGVAAGTGTMAAMLVGAAGGFVGGFLGTLVNGGGFEDALKAGVIGGITGAAFAWAGGVGATNSPARYMAHAAVGCASSVASGGGSSGCARGAASAVIGHAVTQYTGKMPQEARFVAATVSGRVTSRIMGGSFANGAQTAAYGFLFNECLHGGCGNGRRDSYSGSTPLTDSNGRVVIGGDGRPVLMPEGVEMSSFAAAGNQAASTMAHSPAGLGLLAGDLVDFKRGGVWDLQRLNGYFDSRFIDSATIAIGVYSASAGLPIADCLSIQNLVARSSIYAPGTLFDSTYTYLPIRNVINTQIGYSLVRNGRY